MKRLVLFIILIALFAMSCDLASLIGKDDEEDGSSPTHHAEGITFTDTDPQHGQIGGSINIIKALNESDINSYLIYYSVDGTNKSGSAIIELPKKGSNLQYNLPQNTGIIGINYFIVRTKNSHGEMNTGINHIIIDPPDIPDNPDPVDLEVTFRANVQEVYNYNVYTRSNKNASDMYGNISFDTFLMQRPTYYINGDFNDGEQYASYGNFNDDLFNKCITPSSGYFNTNNEGIVIVNFMGGYSSGSFVTSTAHGKYRVYFIRQDANLVNQANSFKTIINNRVDNAVITSGYDVSDIFIISTENVLDNYFIFDAPGNSNYNIQQSNYQFATYVKVREYSVHYTSFIYSRHDSLMCRVFTHTTWNERVNSANNYYKVNQVIATKSDTSEFSNIYINTANSISFEILDNNLYVFLKDVNTKITGIIATFDVVNPNTEEMQSYSYQIQ